MTSVRDNNVSSAAGIALEPIEYKINPRQTNVPCKENKVPLQLDEKNTKPKQTFRKMQFKQILKI